MTMRRIRVGERLARMGDLMLSQVRHLPGWSQAVRSIDQAAGRARQRQLEADLAAANAEIARLRTRLEEATRTPTQFAQMRLRKAAIGRLTRLWLARGGDADQDMPNQSTP